VVDTASRSKYRVNRRDGTFLRFLFRRCFGTIFRKLSLAINNRKSLAGYASKSSATYNKSRWKIRRRERLPRQLKVMWIEGDTGDITSLDFTESHLPSWFPCESRWSGQLQRNRPQFLWQWSKTLRDRPSAGQSELTEMNGHVVVPAMVSQGLLMRKSTCFIAVRKLASSDDLLASKSFLLVRSRRRSNGNGVLSFFSRQVRQSPLHRRVEI